MNSNFTLKLRVTIAFLLSFSLLFATTKGQDDRLFWVKSMIMIVEPVVNNLANSTLRKNMPCETQDKTRCIYAPLEAVGRTVCGIAPWLELGAENSAEGKLRNKYIDLTVKALSNLVNPDSPDYFDFGIPQQPLVDAAFLAQGLLRAPTQLWGNFDALTQTRMISALKRSRVITPTNNNWLLFSSIVEAAILRFTGECDMERLLFGVTMFRDEWYLGDGIYGDGPAYHKDYYNSFVIHPMLTDILTVMENVKIDDKGFARIQHERLSRHAAQLERSISPEGTFPVVGRSIVYRFGVFHALAQAALLKKLPEYVIPAQVRCALTAVLKNQLKSKSTFDTNGWLRIGFSGSQPEMAEYYINTGSLYLCTSVFLPLGLPVSDEFWSAGYTEWTCKKAWSGKEVKADKAIKL